MKPKFGYSCHKPILPFTFSLPLYSTLYLTSHFPKIISIHFLFLLKMPPNSWKMKKREKNGLNIKCWLPCLDCFGGLVSLLYSLFLYQGAKETPSIWVGNRSVLCHPLAASPCQLQPTHRNSTTLLLGKELTRQAGHRLGVTFQPGTPRQYLSLLSLARSPVSLTACLDGFGCENSPDKTTLWGSSHESPTARVSGNWGEIGRIRVCPKTEWDRRLPLLGNLSVCSRDLQNKDLHMVILARTGRFRLSFSTPWTWPPKMCEPKEHLF